METASEDALISLDLEYPIWGRFFSVAPLVVIGSREGDGYNMAPKHMATPIGWQNYFGFVCTPLHATYHNVKHTGAFTVSFPQPSQVVLASLTATPRCDQTSHKPILDALPIIPAEVIDGFHIKDAYLFLECELERMVDGVGANSIVLGRIVAARIHPDAYRASEVDDQDLLQKTPLLAYVSPGRYAALQESFSFPLPANIQW